MKNINENTSFLLKASYLIPDIETAVYGILEFFVSTTLNISSQQLHISLSLSIQNDVINIAAQCDENIWSTDTIKSGFFNQPESFFHYMSCMSKNIQMLLKKGTKSDCLIQESNPSNLMQVYHDHINCEQNCGIVFKINSLFHNLPVRIKYLMHNYGISDLEKCFKKILFYFNSVWLNVHINIKINFQNNILLINTLHHNNISSESERLELNFKQLFFNKGTADKFKFKQVKVDHKLYKIIGFISLKNYTTQKHQIVFYDKKELILPQGWIDKVFNKKFKTINDYNTKQSPDNTLSSTRGKYPILVLKVHPNNTTQNNLDLAESYSRYSRLSELKNVNYNNKKSYNHILLLILEKVINILIANLDFTTTKNYVETLLDDNDSQSNQKKPKLNLESNIFSSNTLKKINAACIYNDYLLPQAQEISKKDLYFCEIVAQLENKFILARFSSLVVIFDQHAVDERVRLESMLNRYMTSIIDGSLKTIRLTNLITTDLLSTNEVLLLDKYSKFLLILGIRVIKQKNGQLAIDTLPVFLNNKIQTDNAYLMDGLCKYMWDLEEKFKRGLKLENLKLSSWWSEIPNLPSIILDIFNSKACKKAVKFGDILTTEQCSIMIKALSRCNLPFQCAHGRPSLHVLNYKNYFNSESVNDYIL